MPVGVIMTQKPQNTMANMHTNISFSQFSFLPSEKSSKRSRAVQMQNKVAKRGRLSKIYID
jgi:hypothetical protein